MKIAKFLAEVYRYDVHPKIKNLRLDKVIWGLMYPGLLLAAVLFDILGYEAKEVKIGVLLVSAILCAITIYVGAFYLIMNVF